MERQSIIKEFAQGRNLQALIDRTQEMFRPIIWPNFFEWRDTSTISYETIIGDSKSGAAASVVAYDVAAPLRTRRAVRKLSGNIPSIREKFRMSEKDLLEYIAMSSMANVDQKAILDLIFDDVRNASEAPHKRLDIFALEAISTGKITLTTVNNPDGTILESEVDFGMPSGNKKDATAKWSIGSTTSKPITDIIGIVKEAEANGILLERMLMKRGTFDNFRKANEVKEYLSSFFYSNKDALVNSTLEKVNEFLTAEGLPKIIIINASIGIETDGVVTYSNPFVDNMVSFLPAGLLGKMYNAPIVEKQFQAKHVTYAEYNRVLIKKWAETDPYAEFTGCELNSFPSWTNVDKCFILDTEPA